MYKTQAACLIVILFIGVMNFSAHNKKTRSSGWFSALLVCTSLQLVFDMLSVYTVNHLETVSPVINRIVHDFYMGFMLSIFYLVYKYIETMIEEELGRRIMRYKYATTIPLIVTILGVVFLPLDYLEGERSNYSYGPAAYMTYVGVAVYVFFIVRLIMKCGKLIPEKKRRTIRYALLSEIPVGICQIIVPDILITCLGMVLLILGIYMTTENPDALLVEQLAKEKRRADSANAAKSTFLANMSHEIRTPITAVLGMNELILRESKEKEIKQYARNVDGAAKSLLSIINDILDISKIEAGKLKVITAEYNVASVLKDVVNMITFKANVKELAFIVQVDESLPSGLMGDDIRLRQILVNLLNNAVKYTHKGSVTLKVTRLDSADEKEAKIRFSVKDTGIGIKEEDLQKLCTPFERIEEKRNRNIEGTGLGMSITKQLLGLLHSQLEVHSVYGEGSEFAFELCQEISDSAPIGPMDKVSEETESGYRRSFVAPKARILMVDDNDLNRRVFVGLLKETRMQIDEASGGKECLEKIQKEKYDIIFLDHMMPEMDGIETLHAMKEMEDYPSKDAPVVILTANAIVGAKEKYLSEGFDAFLAKPIDYKKLEALITELLDESLIQVVSVAEDTEAEAADGAACGRAVNEPAELPMVEGLDWKFASQHFNDTAALLDTVHFFADSLEMEAAGLSELYAGIATEAGQKAYCTKVHSMKNSAATIGIIPLAGMAKVLEDAARNGDTDALERVTPVFLTSWRSYKEKLAVVTGGASGEGDLPGGGAEIGKKQATEYAAEIDALLAQVRTAAEDMDIDALDELWKQLSQYQYEDEQQELMEKVHKAIVEFDVDFLQGV
ncbi:MAG: response regulator [Lachnospiraceae bacterium]|nr:response regulator [Lachnospiraceae bacterium]